MDEFDAVLRDALTPSQRDVVTDPSRWILALACAGSGKSTTLAYRIAYLIAHGADPRSIVAFTFTDNAAESIKLRVTQALTRCRMDPKAVGAMYVGTIHAYCQSVLAEMDARYRQFDVLDTNRLKLYLISRYGELGMAPLRARAMRQSYFETIDQVARAWSTMNDERLPLDDVEHHDAELGAVLRRLRDGFDRNEYVDFSLMIRLTAEALERGDAGAERAVARVRHVMCDEYQDVNPAQEALLRQLERRAETLLVVGDDDQAIFGFRGADVSNILTFEVRYPGCSVRTLFENFRSTDAIVRSSDAFAAAELGATRTVKNPVAVNNAAPRDFRNLWFAARADEAAWVAERIEMLLGTRYVERDGTVRGLTPADVAILMRSTRTEEQDHTPRHRAFTAALLARDIPYTLEAGGSVFERPQVRVLRDTFELLRNGSPDRTTARQLFDTAILPAYASASFDRFATVLADWGRRLHGPTQGPRRRVYPQQLVHDLLNAFGIEHAAFDAGVMHDLGLFSRMMQDVETVFLSIDSAQRFGAICNFLQHVADLGYDSGTDEVLRRPDTVTVSTVHQVKGLEFPIVFVVDVEAGRFPRRRDPYDGWLPRVLINPALGRGSYQSSPDEQARLFYTALTRAERYLYVTGSAHVPAGRRPRQPSTYAQRLAHAELSTDADGRPDGLLAEGRRRRIDETVVPTSYSEIRYYLRCPADYRYRDVYGFSPPITEMFGYGMSIHAAVGKLHERFAAGPPTAAEAEAVGRGIFHLKHVPASGDPVNNPGPYERARDSAGAIVREYAETYRADFERERQLELRFEVPLERAVISGAIDLLLREDEEHNIVDATVIDFKAIEGGMDPERNTALHWTELALQVQLYASAAREVLGENARTGAVHLLKDNQRVEVPVDDDAVAAAIANVTWAVDRIIAGDFPMRPQAEKCAACDFAKLCPKVPQAFAAGGEPPAIHIPEGTQLPLAFSRFDDGAVAGE